MARTVPTLIPCAVRRAERFMIDNAGSPITLSDVADHLGISLRSLRTGFRTLRRDPAALVRPTPAMNQHERSCNDQSHLLCVASTLSPPVPGIVVNILGASFEPQQT
jgi:hypothetical protein